MFFRNLTLFRFPTSLDLNELEPRLALDDHLLALLDRDPLGVAERGLPVLVVVDPDPDVKAAGIQLVADPATAATARHKTPKGSS